MNIGERRRRKRTQMIEQMRRWIDGEEMKRLCRSRDEIEALPGKMGREGLIESKEFVYICVSDRCAFNPSTAYCCMPVYIHHTYIYLFFKYHIYFKNKY